MWRTIKKMTEVLTSQQLVLFALDLCALSVATHQQSSEAASPGKTRNPVKSLGGNRLEEVTSC